MSTKTLATAIRFVAFELEVGGEFAAELAETGEEGFAVRCFRDAQYACVGDGDFYVVAFLQLQRVDDDGGEADGQAIAPFGYLHGCFPWIYVLLNVYLVVDGVKEVGCVIWAVGVGDTSTGAGSEALS